MNILEVIVIEPGETKYIEGQVLKGQHYRRLKVVLKVFSPPSLLKPE